MFYGDYYGIPHDNVPPVPQLVRLIKIRELYAYGTGRLFFDNNSLVGFTREGDAEHPNSGVAVLITDGCGGSKRMYMGECWAGCQLVDALESVHETVEIGNDGWGTFSVNGGSVGGWGGEPADEYLYLNF